jgi:hypothetical protein
MKKIKQTKSVSVYDNGVICNRDCPNCPCFKTPKCPFSPKIEK